MTPVNYELEACRFVTHLEQRIEAQGVTLRCSRDFDEYQTTRDQFASKGRGHLPYRRLFHPDCVDLTPHNAFWVAGRDQEGQIVHLQAVRRDDLGGLSLAQHWQRHYRRMFCLSSDGGRLVGSRAPIASRIGGTVCYHGEVWVAEDLRGRGLGGALGQLALGLALVAWKPDYVYGFVEPHMARRGFHIAEGYMHQFPNALDWDPAPSGIIEGLWLVWMAQEDLVSLARQAPGDQA